MSRWLTTALLACQLLLLTSCGGNNPEPTRVRSGGATSSSPDWVDTADARYEDLVQRLYIGYFGRPADPAGLAFYAHAYHIAGAPENIAGLYAAYAENPVISDLVNSFGTSQESFLLYNNGENGAFGFVHAIYDNLFSRLPDSAGAAFWQQVLNQQSATPARVMLAVMAGASGADKVLLDRKVALAREFTNALHRPGADNLYVNQVSTQITRAMLRSVPALAEGHSALRDSAQEAITRLSDLASGNYREVAAGTHQILLLASAAQLAANGDRIRQLASVLESDLNQLRKGGQNWKVNIAFAAEDVSQIRQQMRGYQSALIIGQVPVPIKYGGPRLDPYRLPDCPYLRTNAAGEMTLDTNAVADLRCKNGLVISFLRGTSAAEDIAQVGSKLDQMISYHSASAAANNNWIKKMRYVNGAWFGAPDAYQHEIPAALKRIGMYLDSNFSEIRSGSAASRRDSFLDCIAGNSEYCGATVHGEPRALEFEGPGTNGVFYSSDTAVWRPADLAAQTVRAKYIDLESCATHAFQYDHSVGTSLLMNGSSLLTRGTTVTTLISDITVQDKINQEFVSLSQGATFAEALLGREEGSPDSLQGDPYITFRSVPVGKLPRLVIDGAHYNSGTVPLSLQLPDSVNGSKLTKVITYTNRGDADLHLRLGTVPGRVGFDEENGYGFVAEGATGDTMYVEYVQIYDDGRVLVWPDFEVETFGGVMHATLQPGQSVAVTYRLRVALDASGKPLRKGRYSWEIVNTSDDPASSRVMMTMQAQIR